MEVDMLRRIALVGLVASGLVGCVSEVGGDSERAGDGEGLEYNGEDINPYKIEQALGADANEFESFTHLTVNGNAATERYVDCGQDQVMTGFGARADDGDVKDITVYCRDIETDGQLGQTELSFTHGGTAQERVVHADAGHVVVGLGGWIMNNSNFGRVSIKQCPWDPQTRTVRADGCAWKGSDGQTFAELQLDTHARYNSTERYRIVATGAGMSQRTSNVTEVRMRVGKLRNTTLLQQSPLAGGEHYFTVTVPHGAKSVDFRTTQTGSDQIGDADLYVRKNAQVSTTQFDCQSWTGSNTETCDFDDINDASGTYYILVDDWRAYEQVRLTVTYSMVR
jgi:hypothetical protein